MVMIAQTLADALAENRLGSPWRNFLRHNRILGPMVEAYVYQGGPRLSDSELQIGVNHYATLLVLVEDARRALTAPIPGVPEVLAGYGVVVQVSGEVEEDGRIPTAALRRP